MLRRLHPTASGRVVQSSDGFSLLELIVVLAVIGVILGVVFPRITGIGGSNLRSGAERISGLLSFLGESAATRKVYYRLNVDLDGEEIRVESSKDGKTFTEEKETPLKRIYLKEGVEIEDMSTPGLGKVTGGRAAYYLTPSGGEPVTLHLRAGKDAMTVSYNPFTGRAYVEKGYVEKR